MEEFDFVWVETDSSLGKIENCLRTTLANWRVNNPGAEVVSVRLTLIELLPTGYPQFIMTIGYNKPDGVQEKAVIPPGPDSQQVFYHDPEVNPNCSDFPGVCEGHRTV